MRAFNFAMSSPEEFDCLSCGACCRDAGEVAVVEDVDDVPRYLTRSVRGIIGFASWEAETTRRMARDVDNQCVALCGEIGSAVRCQIYDRRPAVCRNFEPGNYQCIKARIDAGIVTRVAG